MYIVLLGVPGAGKGTQAKLLQEKLLIPQISTGDLCRQEIGNMTERGNIIKKIVDEGGLVPDEIILNMLKQRLEEEDARSGAIFDGFPRTISQANSLEQILGEKNQKIDSAVFINLSMEEMVKRLSGRWCCRKNDHIFHEIYNPPKVAGICDLDGSQLYQRDDQKDEAVKKRIETYNQNTAPLIEYFENRNILISVNGAGTIDEVHQSILTSLQIS